MAVGAVVLAALVVYGSHARRGTESPPPPPSFEGDSSALKHTQVVATLDARLQKGKSTIWCASFAAAWKVLQRDLAKGPVSLEGGGGLVDLLNRASSPVPDVPKGCLYATAGWEDKGILEKIRTDLAQQFPDKPAPTFPGIVPRSFVAYSYLEAGTSFRLPYFQDKKPLAFKVSAGRSGPMDRPGHCGD